MFLLRNSELQLQKFKRKSSCAFSKRLNVKLSSTTSIICILEQVTQTRQQILVEYFHLVEQLATGTNKSCKISCKYWYWINSGTFTGIGVY